MKFCDNCGAQIDGGAKFCTYCGERLCPAENAAPSVAEAEMSAVEIVPKGITADQSR